MKAKSLFIIVSWVFALTGCSKAPDCSSDNSTSVIKQIIVDQAKKNAAQVNSSPDRLMTHISFDLTGIRTSAHDDVTGRYTCAATLTSAITDEEKKTVSENRDANEMFKRTMRGLEFDGTIISGPISYSVQLTDDKKNVYGEVDNGVVDLILSRVMIANIVDSVNKSNVVAQPLQTDASRASTTQPGAKEVTFTGKIEAEGTSFVGVNSADGTGYTVPTDSNLAKQIFVSCQYGDVCTIIGAVNDDQFVTIKSVSKAP